MAAAETGVVENPLAAEDDAESPPNAGDAGAAAQRSGAVDIKAGLKDGTLTSDEAIVLMEEQMEAREKQLRAEMDAKIAAAQLGAAELHRAARRALQRPLQHLIASKHLQQAWLPPAPPVLRGCV